MRPLLLAFMAAACMSAASTLDFYFIDVEEGSSTLIVSPSGQAMLVDAGSRGIRGRDAGRVMAALKDAGVARLDYLLVTHYHNDHYGAVAELAGKVPILNFVDHGASVETGKDAEWTKHWEIATDDKQYAEYCAVRDRAKHIVVKPGDRIPVPGVEVLVLTSGNDRITSRSRAPGGQTLLRGYAPAIRRRNRGRPVRGDPGDVRQVPFHLAWRPYLEQAAPLLLPRQPYWHGGCLHDQSPRHERRQGDGR